MKRISIFLLLMFVSLCTFAQTQNIIKCYTTEHMEELRRQNPSMPTDADFEREMATLLRQRADNPNINARVGPYVIPVIVHVLHTGQAVGTSPNISAGQVQSQIRVINEDFNRTNPDRTTYWGTRGAGMPGGITFKLATVDPNGVPLAEPGVDRQVIAAQTEYTQAYINTTIKPVTSWDPTRYLNLWTIANPTNGVPNQILLGYAQFPTGTTLSGLPVAGGASTDGVVVNVSSFGTNLTATGAPAGTGYAIFTTAKGRTLTHELGHFFGLRHIWGDAACGDDFCADTPTHAGANQNAPCYTHPKANTCSPAVVDEMFENYMDYTNDFCMNIFTADQVGRMVIGIENGIRRGTLLTSNVADPVGAIAAFAPSTLNLCAPSLVSFAENSTVINGGAISSWVWNFDVTNVGGAFPSTFTGQNPPMVAFSGNGIYTVRLSVTNSVGTNTKTITINANGASVLTNTPLVEDFESTAALSATTSPYNTSSTGSDNWQLNVSTGQGSGSKSAAIGINGFSGQVLRLNAPSLNIASGTSASLQFWVAYSKQSTAAVGDFATLAVEYSEDCGATYNSTPLFTKSNTALETIPSAAAIGGFIPTATQWRQETVDISSLLGKANVRLSFKVTGSTATTGVFLFVDNISISTVGTSQATPNPLFLASAIAPAQGVVVNWIDGSTNETNFELQRAVGVGVFSTLTSPVAIAGIGTTGTYNDATAIEGTVNFYKIRAIGAPANSPFSNTATITVPLKTPTLLVATVAGTTANLTWTDNSAIETGYKVARSTNPTSAFVVIATLATANTNSYADAGLSVCTKYYYRVYAYQGTTLVSANSNTTSSNEVLFNEPTGLVATPNVNKTIALTWVDNTLLETNYKIERKAGNGVFIEIASLPANTLTYLDATTLPFPNGTEMTYRVRATTSATCVTAYSTTAIGIANDAITSVNEKLTSQVSVSPNPANTSFEINFNALSLKAEKIELVNVMGQIVANKTFDQKVVFEVGNLPKGLYYARVNSNKGLIVKKVVIN